MGVWKSAEYRSQKYRKTLKRRIKELPTLLNQNIKNVRENNKIYLGSSYSHNFGDWLNVFLVEYLSEKKVIFAKYLIPNRSRQEYVAIGSIIQWLKKPTIIWGAGLISEDAELHTKNLDIRSVRGPLTLKKLNGKGIVPQQVPFGDPALLMPLIYTPKVTKKYKVGIIPHYVDRSDLWIQKYSNFSEYKVIDVLSGGDWEKFINEVLECEIIISSSLHGLIIADAYGIPSLWISFSNKVMGKGFKFKDYYLSIGIKNMEPFIMDGKSEIKNVVSNATLKTIDLDYADLINSCPFISEKRKLEMLSKI